MRDNFTPATKNTLAFAANFRCVRPGCARVTHSAAPQTGKVINLLGNAAHNTAASVGGARYDDELTHEQRRHYDNGVWLCANCATVIDRLPDDPDFSVQELRRWQAEAMQSILAGGKQGPHPQFFDPRRDSEIVRAFLGELEKGVMPQWNPGFYITWEGSNAMKRISAFGSYRGWDNPRLAQQLPVRNRQLQIIDRLRATLKAIDAGQEAYTRVIDEYSSLVRYSVARQPFESNPMREVWVGQDKMRHAEVCRLTNELYDYLAGTFPLTNFEW